MSGRALAELMLCLRYLKTGAWIAFCYSLLEAFRKGVSHKLLFIYIEDLLFWMCVCVGLFRLQHIYNQGVLRWYLVLSFALGAFLYGKIVHIFQKLCKFYTKKKKSDF